MAKIKHVAITCEDPDAVAKFYKEGFDLFEVARNARQIQLSDGDINLTILKWKTNEDADVGPQRRELRRHPPHRVPGGQPGGNGGETAGDQRRGDRPAGSGRRRPAPVPPRAEEKWSGPNGQVLDISEPGWLHVAPMD